MQVTSCDGSEENLSESSLDYIPSAIMRVKFMAESYSFIDVAVIAD
jgi:hypothetical protein